MNLYVHAGRSATLMGYTNTGDISDFMNSWERSVDIVSLILSIVAEGDKVRFTYIYICLLVSYMYVIYVHNMNMCTCI